MERFTISGKLKSFHIHNDRLLVELEGDYSRALRLKVEDPRVSWWDFVEGFINEDVDMTMTCYEPRICEKVKINLNQVAPYRLPLVL